MISPDPTDVPTQRCTVHKHRNLLAHAPQRLHDEVSADYNDMIYATSSAEIEARRRAFLRKWRLKCKAVADSLDEAGDRLFTFTQLPCNQWKSVRTTNAIERLHEEFKRRIKNQTVLPSAETAAMLFWALLAVGQITMRKVDGWQTLNQKLAAKPIDPVSSSCRKPRHQIPTHFATAPPHRPYSSRFLSLPNRLCRPPSPTHSAARFLVAWLSPRFWYYSAVRLLPRHCFPLRLRL
jgi:hypothetical protein